MRSYQAPAKLNLSLHVSTPVATGRHPLDSIVQTIEWCDRLDVALGEPPDSLQVKGLAGETEENLVLTALREARSELEFPPLEVVLEKVLPIAAGFGGGSSDAAAALLAVAELAGSPADVGSIAARVGGDVPLFLTGGTLRMTGFGERIEVLPALTGFAVAVVQPDFGLGTAEVYARWDELEGPLGEPVPQQHLPPRLRDGMPMRNDLLPAALDVEPRLGDFMADVRAGWETAVCLTGSGSACFGYFASLDEARDAASSVEEMCSVARGVDLRARGVSRVDGDSRGVV